MHSYLFLGTVLPERAQISFNLSTEFVHLRTQRRSLITVSVILNSISARIDSKEQWDIFDLRNVVKSLIQNHLALFTFLKGYAYDIDIKRVLGDQIDYVFGIGIPCIEERCAHIELNAAIQSFRAVLSGEEGVLINRCFNDFASAMKHADDTAFYCYRAIESLKLHNAIDNGLSDAKNSLQWESFRSSAKCTENEVRKIKALADPLRHGAVANFDGNERAQLLTATWDILESYMKSLIEKQNASGALIHQAPEQISNCERTDNRHTS